jgi:hypothetical protein
LKALEYIDANRPIEKTHLIAIEIYFGHNDKERKNMHMITLFKKLILNNFYLTKYQTHKLV